MLSTRLKLRLALLAGLASASVGAVAAPAAPAQPIAPKAEKISAEAFLKEISSAKGSAEVGIGTQELSRSTEHLTAQLSGPIIIGLALS